jgi:hypothetical protein
MGYCGRVIAIGPFSQKFASALTHSAERYADVSEGCAVITTLFAIDFTSGSLDLAEAFGVSGRSGYQIGVAVDAARVDLTRLWDWCLRYRPEFDRACSTVDSFITLRDAGFSFYLFVE